MAENVVTERQNGGTSFRFGRDVEISRVYPIAVAFTSPCLIAEYILKLEISAKF